VRIGILRAARFRPAVQSRKPQHQVTVKGVKRRVNLLKTQDRRSWQGATGFILSDGRVSSPGSPRRTAWSSGLALRVVPSVVVTEPHGRLLQNGSRSVGSGPHLVKSFRAVRLRLDQRPEPRQRRPATSKADWTASGPAPDRIGSSRKPTHGNAGPCGISALSAESSVAPIRRIARLRTVRCSAWGSFKF
jgi:hypothetical protein